MTRLGLTPAQTVGPFLAIGLTWLDGAYAADAEDRQGFWLRGRIVDGAGTVVPDALVETWSADSGSRGFGRSATDVSGSWAIWLRKPTPDAPVAPHLDLSIFARGLLDRLVTRMYFADEEDSNAADPVLLTVPYHRRSTLLASPASDGYTFDITLQGGGETVFFDV